MLTLDYEQYGYGHTPLYESDLELITNGNNQMVFVTLDTPDYVGHTFEFEFNEKYVGAAEIVDA